MRTEFQAETEVLAEIDRWASTEGVSFMVVGALARNILIRQAGAELPRRQTTDIVDLGPVSVRVAPLAAQAVLKLEAWKDRHASDRKDASDLLDLLRTAGVGPYLEETYANEDLLAQYEFDTDLAGIHRLGTDARALLTPDSPGTEHVRALLRAETSAGALLPAHMGADVARNRDRLVAFREGVS